jgi:hypothetical protein
MRPFQMKRVHLLDICQSDFVRLNRQERLILNKVYYTEQFYSWRIQEKELMVGKRAAVADEFTQVTGMVCQV